MVHVFPQTEKENLNIEQHIMIEDENGHTTSSVIKVTAQVKFFFVVNW
jgi:hypothetical protein